MNATTTDVVIIGAGLAGTALALALNKQSIPCRIYEARESNASQISSGVILTPNGLRVLDALGVLERITSRCWKSEYRTYKNDKDETTRKSLIANEKLYGYKNHRLWRTILLDEMKTMLQEQKVPVTYNAKLDEIISDTSEHVTFSINDKQEHASMLIGADGISSSVRKYLDPEVVPEYTGVTGVIGHIKWASVEWPYPDYERACTIQGKHGAIFWIPEDQDGSEIMIGKQAQQPELPRAEWEAMSSDKDRLCEFYRQGYEEWTATARSVIDSLCKNKQTLYLWPFMRMPKLNQWFSNTGRVLIVGDAAHALPPSSGQGVNQALEDVYSLTLLLKSGRDPHEALSYWQSMRQARIDAVFDWATNTTNVQRMPESERNKLIQEGKMKDPKASQDPDDMRWLYQLNLDEQISAWITEV